MNPFSKIPNRTFIRTDGNVLPPPSILVDKPHLKGSEIAVVAVQPSDSPSVRYKGRIWVRVGPRRAIASPQEERILNEKRRYRDKPFDVHPLPSSDLSTLSRVLFEQEYLPNAVASDVLATNERSYPEKLATCRMIASLDDPTPTIIGVLVLGLSLRDWIPGAYIQFLRIAGIELTDPIQDEERVDGPLGQMLRQMDSKMDSHNRSEVDIKSADREIRTQPYPMGQEARKPIFHLTPADGAIGSHAQAVQEAYAKRHGEAGQAPPLGIGQAGFFARDLISHSSTASRSSTSSQPQIMARVWAVRLWPAVIM